jgi:hypothetical protein
MQGEVGSCEVGAGDGGEVKEEEKVVWLVSGLAVLVMVQSGMLAMIMVLAGG